MADDPTIRPTPIADGTRRRQQASTQLLHEWASMQPWDVAPIYELRLGPTPLNPGLIPVTPRIDRMLRVSNRYADLVGVIYPNLLVVEAEMVADPGSLSQLQHYIDLIPGTEALRQLRNLPVQGVLLWAVDDAILHQRAVANGIRVELYQPPWAADYLTRRYTAR